MQLELLQIMMELLVVILIPRWGNIEDIFDRPMARMFL